MPDPMFVELDGALRKAFGELREYEQKSGSGTGVARALGRDAEHYADL
jgi:hypothetical protein